MAGHGFGGEDVVPEAEGVVHEYDVHIHPPDPFDGGEAGEGFLEDGNLVPVDRFVVGEVVGGDVGPHEFVAVAVGVGHAVFVDHLFQVGDAEEAAGAGGGGDHDDFAGIWTLAREIGGG